MCVPPGGLCNLSMDPECQDIILQSSGISLITNCLSSQREETVLSAITTLMNLVSPSSRSDIASAAMVQCMLRFSLSDSPRLRNLAAVFLQDCCSEEQVAQVKQQMQGQQSALGIPLPKDWAPGDALSGDLRLLLETLWLFGAWTRVGVDCWAFQCDGRSSVGGRASTPCRLPPTGAAVCSDSEGRSQCPELIPPCWGGLWTGRSDLQQQTEKTFALNPWCFLLQPDLQLWHFSVFRACPVRGQIETHMNETFVFAQTNRNESRESEEHRAWTRLHLKMCWISVLCSDWPRGGGRLVYAGQLIRTWNPSKQGGKLSQKMYNEQRTVQISAVRSGSLFLISLPTHISHKNVHSFGFEWFPNIQCGCWTAPHWQDTLSQPEAFKSRYKISKI